ncbi:MAG: hypothetical protein ACYCZY_07525 [Lacisediminihabitans sp.]
MTKKVHPARGARTFTGAASALALVGIVTGFQMAANAQVASVPASVTDPTVTPTVVPVAPVTAVPVAAAPAAAPAPAPVAKPAPAPVAKPAPAPAAAPAPVNGTTAGSGG